MEEVERTNTVIIRNSKRQIVLLRRNFYVIDIDKERSCYNCGRFGYLVRNCRNKGTEGRIRKGKKLEYENGNNKQRRMIKRENRDNNNLNRE